MNKKPWVNVKEERALKAIYLMLGLFVHKGWLNIQQTATIKNKGAQEGCFFGGWGESGERGEMNRIRGKRWLG